MYYKSKQYEQEPKENFELKTVTKKIPQWVFILLILLVFGVGIFIAMRINKPRETQNFGYSFY